MFDFRKKQPELNEQLVLEKGANKNLKRLDRIYIIVACVLGLSWAVWNFGDVKLPKLDFSFFGDYLAERRASKNPPDIVPQNSHMAADGDHIVYLNFGSNELFTIKKDGSENTKIASNLVLPIVHIKDGYVYYVQRGRGIIRVKVDGSEETVLQEAITYDGYFKLIGDYIYYQTTPGSYWRTSLDGKKQTEIKQSLIGDFFAVGNWIYEANSVDKTVYRFKSGSTEKEAMFKFQGNIDNFGVYRDRAYYIDRENLITCRLDGSEQNIIDNDIYYFAVEEDKIYYAKNVYSQTEDGSFSGYGYTLITSNLDGSEKKELIKLDNSFGQYIGGGVVFQRTGLGEQMFNDVKANKSFPIPEIEYKVLVQDLGSRRGTYKEPEIIRGSNGNLLLYKTPETLYYRYRENTSLFKYDINKKEVTSLLNEQIISFEASGNFIFYTKSGENGLFVLDMQNGKSEKVFNYEIQSYTSYEDGIYFTTANKGLYRLSFSDNSVSKVVNEHIGELRRVGDYLYFITLNDRNLNRMKLTEGSYEFVAIPGNFHKFDIVGDYIYFFRSENLEQIDGGGLYRQRVGSSSVETVIKSCTFDYYFNSDRIFFSTLNRENQGYPQPKVSNLDGSGIRSIDINCDYYYIDGDFAYTIDYKGNLEMSRLQDYLR